jgi:hypothetical protein
MPWPRRNPPATATQPASIPQSIVNCRPTFLTNVVVSICRQDQVFCAKISKELNRLTEMAKKRRSGIGVMGAKQATQGTKRKDPHSSSSPEWESVMKKAKFEMGTKSRTEARVCFEKSACGEE